MTMQNGTKCLSTVSPAETSRLLIRYLELRKEKTQQVYGITENEILCYWTTRRADAQTKAKRWGLKSKYLGRTDQELAAYCAKTTSHGVHRTL